MSGVRVSFLRDGWNRINLVFTRWRVSLLAFNHEETLESSLFIVSTRVEISLWPKKMLVSSAKRINERRFEQ